MSTPRKGQHISTTPRLLTPEGLSPAQSALFARIVQSLDPSHFVPSDYPLLTQYCIAATMASDAAMLMAAEGTIVDGKVHPALVVHEKAVRALGTLAPKLRICPSARMDRYMAGSNSRSQPGAASLPASQAENREFYRRTVAAMGVEHDD